MEGLRRIFDNRDDIRATFVEDIQAGLTGTSRLPPGGRAGSAPWTALRAAGPAQLISGSTQQGPVPQGAAGLQVAAGLPGHGRRHSGVSAAAAGQHTTGDALVATPRTTTRTHQKGRSPPLDKPRWR